jgi:hypothetical protein
MHVQEVLSASRKHLQDKLHDLVDGEELDQLGYHRIHGLGLEHQGRGFVLDLPSGGGKSAMALTLLTSTKIKILSDETPLISDGGQLINPFPVRIALRPQVATALGVQTQNYRHVKRRLYPEKVVIPIPPDRVADSCPLSVYIIGCVDQRDSSGPHFTKAETHVAAASLLKSMVIGHGVAQMAEHMLRPLQTLTLAQILKSRMLTAMNVIRSCDFYKFHIGSHAGQNTEALLNFLKER